METPCFGAVSKVNKFSIAVSPSIAEIIQVAKSCSRSKILEQYLTKIENTRFVPKGILAVLQGGIYQTVVLQVAHVTPFI